MADKEVKLSTEEKLQKKISEFAVKNSKGIFIAVIALIVAVFAIVIVTTSVSNSREKALVKVEELADKYVALDKESETFASDVETFVSDCTELVRGKRYPSVKAQYLIGLAYYDSEDFAKAYDAFMACYNLNEKIHLAELALINAAACAESNGDVDKALELYEKISVDYADSESAVVPKALFNAGRIYMQKGSTELAKTTFEQLTVSYSLSEYAKLAKNILNVL